MISKINPRITDISLTYVLFISMVIVPNIILGIFGYITLRTHESDAEENKKKAYEIVLSNLIEDVNAKLNRSNEGTNRIVKSIFSEDIVDNLDLILKKSKIFKHAVFFDEHGNLLFGKSYDQKAQENFTNNYKSALIARIDEFFGKYPTRFIIESAVKDKFETFYCISVNYKDANEKPGILALMYNQQKIFDDVIRKRFESLNLDKSVNVKLSQSIDFQTDEDVVLKMIWKGSNFPYWRIILKHTDYYKDNKRSTSSLFLMIFGLLLPLVGAALIGLRIKLLREMRVAHLKTDFISRVTHELRTPLTSIKMFSEMLDMDSIPEVQKKNCIDVIQRETERLAKLVDRVLNFSKLESRNKVFTFEKTDIEKLVVETVRFFEKQIPDKDFKIKLLKDPRIREVMIDKDGIREILLNLIENSYKYSSDDKEITVKIQKIENDMRILVIDNGFGIPREDLGRVFQKFYRVDDQINRAIDGTGLGLSICMDIAKAHGGNISVESERGAGSKFIVSIPLKFKPAQWAKYMVQKKYPWE